ncbi:MAG: hypothetical protein R2745_11905 [Vicinamibacterales bacterium]
MRLHSPPPSSPSGLPRWVWAVYLVLFAASVPWYVPAGPVRLWFGLPHWVVLSLVAMAGVSAFTILVVRRYWLDEGDDDAGEGER